MSWKWGLEKSWLPVTGSVFLLFIFRKTAASQWVTSGPIILTWTVNCSTWYLQKTLITSESPWADDLELHFIYIYIFGIFTRVNKIKHEPQTTIFTCIAQVLILTPVLNCLVFPRPHIFLVMRTRSADGLLLHITDKHGFARVILFISSGRVKLFVGNGTLIYYQKKINNAAWHNVRHWFHHFWVQNDIIGL